MTNIKKRIKKSITLLMVFLCILSFNAPVEGMRGVDLSRIKFSTSTVPVELRFGKVVIPGKASLVYPFTEEEIDKLAKETLTEMKISQLDILDANKKIEKAHRATTLTQEDIDRVKENILTSMGTVPAASDVATLLTFIDKTLTSKSWDDIGTLSVDLGANAMSDKVKDTAKGMITEYGDLGEEFIKKYEWIGKLDAVLQFCTMIDDEHTRDKEKWKSIAEGANAKRLLNKFYDKLQNKIEAYKYKSDEAGWYIQFDQVMVGRYFSFFGVGNNFQTWTLDMILKQSTTDSMGSIAGEYNGVYAMNVRNEMSGFAQNLELAVDKLEPIKKLQAAYKGIKGMSSSFSSQKQGKASVDRIISGNCNATVQKDGTIILNMQQDVDDTQVNFSNLSVDLNLIYETDELGAVMRFSFPFEITNKEQSLQMKVVSLNVKDLAKDINVDKKYTEKTEVINIGWDPIMWEPWDKNEKKLILLN